MSTESYKVLQALVKEQDFEQREPVRGLFDLGLYLAMMFGGIALFLVTDLLVVKIAGLLISTSGGLGIATSTHTSSHYATCDSRGTNRFLTYFGYTALLGISASYWYNKHCVVHHPAPNLIGVDDDIDLAPFFSITELPAGAPRPLFHRVQWLVIPFALALNSFNVQKTGWAFLIKRLRDPRHRRPGHWVDLATLILHWTAWVVLPMLWFSPLSVIGFHALRTALFGYAMFIAFAPAHFPEEAVAAVGDEQTADFVLRQAATTVNFRTGRFGALMCNGVEYQIEHHLFPAINPRHYPELSKIVEAFCRERGYPYRTLGWWESVWKSLVVFYRPKPVLRRLTDCMKETIPSPRTGLAVAPTTTGATSS